MEIIDNFLDQKDFDELQTLMMGINFAWYYSPKIVCENELTDRFQFSYSFYKNNAPTSTFLNQLYPIFELINPISLWRIKANLLTKTAEIEESSFHVDMLGVTEERLKQWTTSILYMNTNDGYTEFQDGRIAMENTKVESVANRMVTFPANLRHRGTSCTDEKMRVVINFNYFK